VLKVVTAPVNDTTSGDQQYFSAEEFLTRTGLDASTLGLLQSLGLIVPVSIERQISFTAFDVRVAVIAHSLMERGVDVRLLGSLRRVAEREIGLVDDLTQSLRAKGSGVSGEKARAITADVAGEVAVLRAVLYERALQDYLER
jgi:hypothetical protein